MKISELENRLRGIREKQGDIEVYCWPYDGQGDRFELDSLDVFEYKGQPVLQIDSRGLGAKEVGTDT